MASRKRVISEPQLRCLRRRHMHVRFEDEHHVDPVRRKGRVHEIERPSFEEVKNRWLSRREVAATIRLLPRAAEAYRLLNPAFAMYEESLQTTYVSCVFAVESDGLPDGINTSHLSLLSADFLRGLEAHAVPCVGRDRAQNRLSRLQTVVQLHRHLRSLERPQTEIAVVLRKVAQDFSKTARMFARVMATADELAVAADRLSLRCEATGSPPTSSVGTKRQSEDPTRRGCVLPVA